MCQSAISVRMENLPSILTVNEAAELLRVHPVTLRKWIAAGNMPVFRVGRNSVRISRAQVERMLNGDTAEAKTTA